MEEDNHKMPLGIHGSHLAEVFNIQIKINSVVERYQVYGTIQVEDSQGTLTLFHRCSENVESVYECGSLSLIAKERPIDASGSFEVIFDLKDNDGNEFIKNSFFVDANNIHSLPFRDHEKCCIVEVGGILGRAIVTYAIYQIGVLACLLTHYVNDSSDNECEYVYGNLQITQYDDEFGLGLQEDTRVVLFDKSTAKEAVQLNKKDDFEIPLNRDFVAVPAYCSIRVEGDLHFRLSNGLVDSINISKQLSADNLYWEVKDLKGKYGYIKFNFTWRNSFSYVRYRRSVLARPSRFSNMVTYP